MKSRLSLGLYAAGLFCAASLPNLVSAKQFQQTGTHGGSVSATSTQSGNKVSGTAVATGANGKSTTATGTATVRPGSVSAQGSVKGPNGGTASGTATASSTAVNASGTATGKNGKTVSGSVAAAPGTATVTSGSGQSKTLSSANAPTHP